eukprot:5634447-Prymnesium_polylepis.1
MGLIIHPAASTITYLSSVGAPTVVLPSATISAAGEYRTGRLPTAHLVPPAIGRHVRFDGRLLHGAPASILPGPANGAAAEPYERVTFCVNIWVGHKPSRCRVFEASPFGGAGMGWPSFRLRHADARTAVQALAAPHATVRPHATPAREEDAARLRAFELLQSDEPHTLLLALPGSAALRRALEAGTVLDIRSEATEVRAGRHEASSVQEEPAPMGNTPREGRDADGADKRRKRRRHAQD